MTALTPEVLQKVAPDVPCSFCNGTGVVIAQPGNVRMSCPFTSRHVAQPAQLPLEGGNG